MKRFLCMLTALCVLLSVSFGETADRASGSASDLGTPRYYAQNDRVTLIEGDAAGAPVRSMEEAAAVVDSVLDRLGGDARTELVPLRVLTDVSGNKYYVFQQFCNHVTVLGGAVKVITDPEGWMLALTSSLVSDLPEEETAEPITAGEAEQLVLREALEKKNQHLQLQEGLTNRIVLPTMLVLDLEDEDPDENSRFVWAVYTDNPGAWLNQNHELPYLAHYVTLSGEYLYSLPTIYPGDEAGQRGFDSSYVFEFMEPAEYTGYVDLSTGEEVEITVTVMQDRRTGMYYLGNMERKIVVADCWEYLYNGGKVLLESSRDNREWDQVGLLALYNYCRAYDYYREIGWIGGDGLGTPILILNNYCDLNHKPVDNAAYVGPVLGWQMFLVSRGNDLSQCLDVIAHEFTHCVTGTVMTYNAYVNDYGAINEAISDIQGKNCQMMMDGRENTTWVLGDRSQTPFRYMDEPTRASQPAFAWDLYYHPNVKTPSALNDEGGVHSNSSLLSHLAWRLAERGGMSPEEARAFWFAVDCAMVPGTDYPQLAELLPVMLRIAGMEKYSAELAGALDAVRLSHREAPDILDADRALLTLNLPDEEIYGDGQWILMETSVDVEALTAKIREIAGYLTAKDYSFLPQELQEEIAEVQQKAEAAEAARKAEAAEETEDTGFLDALLGLLLEDSAPEPEAAPETDPAQEKLTGDLLAWAAAQIREMVYNGSTNGGMAGRSMKMVCRPGYCFPTLVHGVLNNDTQELEQTCVLLYLGDRWIDLGLLMGEDPQDGGETDSQAAMEMMEPLLDRLFSNFGNIRSLSDIADLCFYRIQGGQVNVLPTAGLEGAEPANCDAFFASVAQEEQEDTAPRLSRPKETPAPEEASVTENAAAAEETPVP